MCLKKLTFSEYFPFNFRNNFYLRFLVSSYQLNDYVPRAAAMSISYSSLTVNSIVVYSRTIQLAGLISYEKPSTVRYMSLSFAKVSNFAKHGDLS